MSHEHLIVCKKSGNSNLHLSLFIHTGVGMEGENLSLWRLVIIIENVHSIIYSWTTNSTLGWFYRNPESNPSKSWMFPLYTTCIVLYIRGPKSTLLCCYTLQNGWNTILFWEGKCLKSTEKNLHLKTRRENMYLFKTLHSNFIL